MRILVTNDDGVRAEGLQALVRALEGFGEVKIVAPDHEQSACGHGMTLRRPLRVWPVEWDGHEAYEVDGLPVDCINVGLTVAWPEGCDLILSGINNGPNLGFDVTYSGTVAGAIEGAINGIRSISISMAVFVSGAPYHYETGQAWLKDKLPLLLELPNPPLSFFNINVPAIAAAQLRGHRFVAMGKRVYEDRVIRREDPWGRPYYWQGGSVVMSEEQPGTDVEAVRQGYVAITPLSLDWTHPGLLGEIEGK
ncbi:MAG: 5'/3'-nucleotidase SurE [Fimbriimonadaceae bacterium]|nr:5'/3'-nucleotidase SurE [Fimbriimonadaceae bacterium]